MTAAAALTFALIASAGNARAEQIAAAPTSEATRQAMASIDAAARAIKDDKLRAAVLALLARPAPTFLAAWDAADAARARREAHHALVAAGHVDQSVAVDALFPALPGLSFRAAPGGILGRHHGHPGGLAVHTAFNLSSARALLASYRAQYGVELDEDLVTASVILHDVMKAWCLQFNNDGSLLVQPMVAGTSSHHPFIVAEAMHRGLSDDLIVALAAAHEPPNMEPAKVAGFIAAAAVLARRDAASARRLISVDFEKRRLAHAPRIEASINHLSDHDYVLADPAYAQVDEALDAILPPSPERAWRKHEILARVPGLTLYGAYVRGGVDAVRAIVK